MDNNTELRLVSLLEKFEESLRRQEHRGKHPLSLGHRCSECCEPVPQLKVEMPNFRKLFGLTEEPKKESD